MQFSPSAVGSDLRSGINYAGSILPTNYPDLHGCYSVAGLAVLRNGNVVCAEVHKPHLSVFSHHGFLVQTIQSQVTAS